MPWRGETIAAEGGTTTNGSMDGPEEGQVMDGIRVLNGMRGVWVGHYW